MQEMVWTRENRLLKLFESRSVRGVAIGVVALGAIAGPLTVVLAGKRPSRTEHPVAAASLSPTPSTIDPLKDSFIPEGIVVYPTTNASDAMVAFETDGTVRPCLRSGTHLTLIGYSQGWITYGIGPRVVRRAGCGGKPIDLVNVAKVLRDRKAAIRCAALSPLEDELFVWAGTKGHDRYIVVDSKSRVKLLRAENEIDECRWIDEHHILARYNGDGYGIDVRTGAESLLLEPALWEGYVSPAGSAALYQTVNPWCPECDADFHVLETTGDTHATFGRGTISWQYRSGVTPWSPDGSQLVGMLDSGDPVLYTPEGDSEAIRGPLEEPLNEDSASVGWLDDSTLWYATQDGVWVEDTESHASVKLELPGFHQNPNVDGILTVLARATREGLRTARNVVSDAATPVYRDRKLGISFHRPPSWTTDTCDACTIGPYKAALRISSSELANGEGVLSSVVFATTTTGASNAATAVIHHLGADTARANKCDDADICATVHRSRVVYDGISFQRLDFGFYEGADTVLVASTARGTLLVDFGTWLEDEDPSVGLMLRTLRVA